MQAYSQSTNTEFKQSIINEIDMLESEVKNGIKNNLKKLVQRLLQLLDRSDLSQEEKDYYSKMTIDLKTNNI